jgi:hypothetical protein
MLKYVLSKQRLYIDEIDQNVAMQDIYIADGESEKDILDKLSKGGYELGVIDNALLAVPIKKYIPEFYQQIELNQQALDFLEQTDWVSSKYIDTVLANKLLSESEFLEKYQDVLNQRQDARQQIKSTDVLKVWQ